MSTRSSDVGRMDGRGSTRVRVVGPGVTIDVSNVLDRRTGTRKSTKRHVSRAIVVREVPVLIWRVCGRLVRALCGGSYVYTLLTCLKDKFIGTRFPATYVKIKTDCLMVCKPSNFVVFT